MPYQTVSLGDRLNNENRQTKCHDCSCRWWCNLWLQPWWWQTMDRRRIQGKSPEAIHSQVLKMSLQLLSVTLNSSVTLKKPFYNIKQTDGVITFGLSQGLCYRYRQPSHPAEWGEGYTYLHPWWVATWAQMLVSSPREFTSSERRRLSSSKKHNFLQYISNANSLSSELAFLFTPLSFFPAHGKICAWARRNFSLPETLFPHSAYKKINLQKTYKLF